MAEVQQNEQAAENQQQGGESKVTKKFRESMEKLLAVMGGPGNTPSKKPRVRGDRITVLVNEMLQERAKKTEAEFKEKANNLLDKWIVYNSEVEKIKKDFEKDHEKKMEDFVKEAEGLFSMITGLDQLRQNYEDNLRRGTGQQQAQ